MHDALIPNAAVVGSSVEKCELCVHGADNTDTTDTINTRTGCTAW